MMDTQGSESFYTSRINTLNTRLKKHQRADGLYTAIRMAGLLSFIALLIYRQQFSAPLLYGLLALSAGVFIWTVLRRNTTQLNIRFLKNKIELNQKERSIIRKEYSQLYEGSDLIEKEHPYETDLDIFGTGSLFQSVNRTSTLSGLQLLSSWLKQPFLNASDIYRNQEAVKELSTSFEWCQDFCSRISGDKAQLNDKASFFNWMAIPNRLLKNRVYSYLIYILPALSIVLGIAAILELLSASWFWISVFVQLLITVLHARRTNQVYLMLGPGLYYVDGILSIVELITAREFSSAGLNRLKASLSEKNAPAIAEIKKLKRISDAFDNRLNPILAIILNGIFLYDIRLVWALEKWKTRNQHSFDKWHSIIGELDALVSLALFSYNHPHYVFPEVHEESFYIHAEGVKHPLMDEEKVVANNYAIQGTPRIDILTGANMSGKSTFLRTIGVSLVLAMAGAPVNASRFVFAPIHIFTSLRTNDSLLHNESFFYAELKKLKRLMDTYSRTPNVFFLLDEILKGTNSVDQHNGARKLIKKLISINAFGIIATHDLALSGLSADYPKSVRNIRFEIQILNGKMNFGYKLEEGVAETMNGTFLLTSLGIVP